MKEKCETLGKSYKVRMIIIFLQCFHVPKIRMRKLYLVEVIRPIKTYGLKDPKVFLYFTIMQLCDILEVS